MQLHPTTNYTTDRYNFLRELENYVSAAYVDSVGVATIGVGINLRVHQNLVLQTLGFDVAGTTLTGAALTAEQGYIQQIRNALNAPYTPNRNDLLQAALAPIMTARSQNTSYPQTFTRRASFAFTDESESRTVFNAVMQGYSVAGQSFAGYEQLLNDWLTQNGIQGIGNSKERIALISLRFNSKDPSDPRTLLGPKLAAALHNDDCAEAWYEIRYNSNAGASASEGIAKRRFAEADTFGLYNDASVNNDLDAKGAFRTYTRHKAGIDAYEQQWARGLDLALSQFPSVVQTRDAWLQPARTYLYDTYVNPVSPGLVLNGDIWVGETAGDPNTSAGSTLYYRGTDTDLLTGTSQSDLIFGESGNDILDGGQSNDVLYGGAGQDIYRIRPEDGNDIIIDSDGKGLIVYGADGQTQTLALGIRQANDPAGQYRSLDGSVVYQLNGTDLTVTLPNQQQITVKNYTPGDLHLSLLDKPADPSGPVLTGTESNNADVTDTGVPEGLAGGGVLDRNWQGYQSLGGLAYPANGESGGLYFLSRDGSNLTYQTILGQGGDDFLLGNPGAENIRLDGGSGNDWIIADYNDVYSAFQNFTIYTPGPGVTTDGGTGNDALQGGFHDDWIEGGSGHDQLYGGQGEDYLAGGTGNDWLAASDGDDVVIGGPDTATNGEPGNDTLLGGAGADNLLGGTGDDALYGDTGGGFLRQIVNVGNGTLALVAWNGATQQFLIPNFAGAAFQESLLTDVPLSDAGDDYLDGGAGNDKLFGGAGSDILDGGADNDKLYGEAGDDVLFGGAGNDELWGDKDAAVVAQDRQISETHGALSLFNREYHDGAEVAGNDVLDGGAGDDKLYGGKGNDTNGTYLTHNPLM